MIELPRRKFLTGLASLIAAPAIVRADSLMQISGVPLYRPDHQLSYVVTGGLECPREYIVFEGALSSGELSNLQTYFAAKYGIRSGVLLS